MTQGDAPAARVLRDHFTLGVKSKLEMPGEKFKVAWRHAVKRRVPEQKFNNRCWRMTHRRRF